MSTFTKAVEQGTSFRRGERSREHVVAVVASLRAGEDLAKHYPEMRWARSLDASEAQELDALAAVISGALLETLHTLARLEELEFDSEDAFAWKLSEALLEREGLEGLRVLFLRAGTSLERLERELDLLDVAGRVYAKHFRMLLVPHLEEGSPLKAVSAKDAEDLVSVSLLDHTAWWGQPDAETRIALAKIDAE